MFENFFKKGKGQTSLEILIVMGGLIIIAVVVVTIILASSKSKVTQITDADKQNAEIIDKTLFPPNINSLVCVYENNQVTYNISIIPSVTKDISEYCLIVNGVKTDNCVPANQSQLSFTSSEVGNGNYKVALVSKNIQNAISGKSVTFNCNVAVEGTQNQTPTFPSTVSFSCPTGYSKVPGSLIYGTNYNNGGFCVMTWEAKMDYDGDTAGDINTECINYFTSPGYFYMTWDLYRCPVTPGERSIVSTAEGMPVANTSLANARDHCSELGPNYHLITNEEWMTIARNLEFQPTNWTGGVVGAGKVKVGNTGNVSGGYYLQGATASAITVFWDGTTYTDYLPMIDFKGLDSLRSKREQDSPARLVLSTGDEVWDFSGNMLEFVDKTLPGQSIPRSDNSNKNKWIEFFQLTSTGALEEKDFMPSNPMWGYNQGMGMIITNFDATGNILFLRGGGSYHYGNNYSAYAGGIYSLHLTKTGITPTSASLDNGRGIGFRCVYVP